MRFAVCVCLALACLGATLVGISMVIELTFLDGRKKLDGTMVHSLITY